MKKQLLTLAISALSMGTLSAQTVIFDNGPIFDLLGGGAGGANASSLHSGMGTYGAGHAVSTGFRVADDIVVPSGETWMIDSLAFYAYQTGSGNISTITEVNVQIWDGVPGDPGSTVIFGDPTTNVMIETDWTGTYRTGDMGAANCPAATCIDRPIMRNVTIIGQSLAAGTYWIDWQVGGSGASGPWAPPVNLGVGLTTTGNSKQYNPTTLLWTDLADGALLTEFQGMPYQAIGSVITGIGEIDPTLSVSVYPNPVSEYANVILNFEVTREDNVSFTMYDVLGKIVHQVNGITTQQFTVNRNSMKNGVYFYEVSAGGKSVKNGKIVLQ